jgi:hypothetical protein
MTWGCPIHRCVHIRAEYCIIVGVVCCIVFCHCFHVFYCYAYCLSLYLHRTSYICSWISIFLVIHSYKIVLFDCQFSYHGWMYVCVCVCVCTYLFKMCLSVNEYIRLCWLIYSTQGSNSGWLFYGLILRRFGLNMLVPTIGIVVSNVVSTAC